MAHSAPAIAPISRPPAGLTECAAGVMATRPATMPDAPPSEVAWPSRRRSTSSQASIAAAVAPSVLIHATPAVVSAARAEPALKPNQPNHSRPAPSITSGRLCGRIGIRPKPTRLPSTSARASAPTPALMWMAVPPAKSTAPITLATKPPWWPDSVSNENTACAAGKYTSSAHRAANAAHAENFMRSATAPETSATAMIANADWKPAKTMSGTPPVTASGDISPLRKANSNGLPIRRPIESPKAME